MTTTYLELMVSIKPDRRRARILAMQMLCQLDVQGDAGVLKADNPAALLADRFEEEATPATTDYACTLIDVAWQQWRDSEKLIGGSGSAWDVKRMGLVDRNVIRVALAELSLGQVPPRVVLSEAVEIAREYASAESAGFVNGVLDQLYKAARHGE